MQHLNADGLKAVTDSQLEELARFYDRRCWTASPSEYARHGQDWEDALDLIEDEQERRGIDHRYN